LEPGHDLCCELGRELVLGGLGGLGLELVHGGFGLELTFWWKDAFENITMQLRRLWRMI